MSYFRIWSFGISWGRVDSNHRTLPRTDLQSVAIAAMRLPLSSPTLSVFESVGLEPMKGLEPPTGWLQISYSTNWVTSAFINLSNHSFLELRLQKYDFISKLQTFFQKKLYKCSQFVNKQLSINTTFFHPHSLDTTWNPFRYPFFSPKYIFLWQENANAGTSICKSIIFIELTIGWMRRMFPRYAFEY